MGMDPITLGAIIAAGTTLATTGATIGTQMATQQKAPALPEMPKVDTNKALQETDERQRRQAAVAGGRGKTILTNPLGLDETSPSNQPTLLGN